MAITVDLIRNVLTSKYLTYSGSTIALHSTRNHSDNFHIYANGPTRTLQVFSNSNKKFTHAPAAGECNQGFTISSTGSMIHVTKSSAGVKLHVVDSNGNKYYLRINTVQNNAVELVCQSYVDNVSTSPYFRQELEFDLVTVDSADLQLTIVEQ